MQFQKGQSGNPAGRPRGSRNKASIRMQELLEQKAEQLVNKAVEMAVAGNSLAVVIAMFAAAIPCSVALPALLFSADFPLSCAFLQILHLARPLCRALQGNPI
jgi:hypothetical protein